MLETLLPHVQKAISIGNFNSLKKNGIKAVAGGLYAMMPSPVRLLVKEKTFIEFCMNHQDKIFGKTVPAKNPVKKIAAKKAVAKKVVKKAAAKKKTSR